MKLTMTKALTALCLTVGMMSSAQAAVEGYKLYQDTCAKCHGEAICILPVILIVKNGSKK